jgi:GNAT superfamily N-acetyltransferase
VEIQRLRAHQADQLRELRLRALQDAPDAFAERFEDVQLEPASYWQAFADASEAADGKVNVVAVEDGRWLAMGAAFLYEDAPNAAGFVAMWVDRSVRGTGVGRRLLDALAEWARSRGATRAVIWHTEGNAHAEALYRAYGFEPTGTRRQRRSDPTTHWIEMARTL